MIPIYTILGYLLLGIGIRDGDGAIVMVGMIRGILGLGVVTIILITRIGVGVIPTGDGAILIGTTTLGIMVHEVGATQIAEAGEAVEILMPVIHLLL